MSRICSVFGQTKHSSHYLLRCATESILGLISFGLLTACQTQHTAIKVSLESEKTIALEQEIASAPNPINLPLIGANGRPQLSPLPPAEQIWTCEVVVIGGSLGGVAAAGQAMASGATTCLIELTPWLGGQISSQGVSAIDESLGMRAGQNYSPAWKNFKQVIERQPLHLPAWLTPPLTHPLTSKFLTPMPAGSATSVFRRAQAHRPRNNGSR